MQLPPLAPNRPALPGWPALCFSSLGCPGDSPSALCRRAADHGISLVEIRTLQGKIDFPGFLTRNPDRARSLQAVLRRYHVSIRLLASAFSLTLQREEDIPALLEVGTLADALGIPYVRVFGGGHEGEAMGKAEIRSAAGIYSKLQARWESQKLAARLLVETHGGLVTSKAIKAFDEATGGEVLYLWDSHHTWKSGGDTPEQTAALIGSRVRHIHCKDSIPAAERRSGYRYVLPGAGDFPFPELLRVMRDLDLATALSLEWEKQWHPELPPVDGALEAFLATVATLRDSRIYS